MRKKSIWSGVIMLMILSWVGGCTYAQETVEVVDVEVCPEVPAWLLLLVGPTVHAGMS